MASEDIAKGFIGLSTAIKLVQIGEMAGLVSAAEVFAAHGDQAYTGAEVAAVLRGAAFARKGDDS